MAELKYLIDNSNLQKVIDDWLYIYPNNEKDGDDNLIWTDSQWIKEHVRRWIVGQIKRSRQKQSVDQAGIIGSTDGEVTNA